MHVAYTLYTYAAVYTYKQNLLTQQVKHKPRIPQGEAQQQIVQREHANSSIKVLVYARCPFLIFSTEIGCKMKNSN